MSLLLRQLFVPFLIKILQDVLRLLGEVSPITGELVQFQHRSTSPEPVVELTEVDVFDAGEVESVCAHDAGLDSDEQYHLLSLFKAVLSLELFEADELGVLAGVLGFGCHIVGRLYYLVFLVLEDLHEDPSNRHFINLRCLLCLLQSFLHQLFDQLLPQHPKYIIIPFNHPFIHTSYIYHPSLKLLLIKSSLLLIILFVSFSNPLPSISLIFLSLGLLIMSSPLFTFNSSISKCFLLLGGR